MKSKNTSPARITKPQTESPGEYSIVAVDTKKAWSRIGNDDWDQMAWFVRLTNTTAFEQMPKEAQSLWQEEFAAILLRGAAPVIGVPKDARRYPRSTPTESHYVPYLPSNAQMQEVRDVITPHIMDLADDKGTLIGNFTVSLSVSFHKNAAHNREPSLPRYHIYQGETSGLATSNIYRRALLLRVSNLLGVHADKIRRCKLCRNIFLQLKRSAKYCGPKCYTVGCMQVFRASQKRLKLKQRKPRRLQTLGGASHGKKRR